MRSVLVERREMGSLMPGWNVDEPGHTPKGLQDEFDLPSSPKSPTLGRRSAEHLPSGEHNNFAEERKGALGSDEPHKHSVFMKVEKQSGDGTGNDDGNSAGPPPGCMRVHIPARHGSVVLEADHVPGSTPKKGTPRADQEMVGEFDEVDANPLESKDKWWRRTSASALNKLETESEEPAHGSGNYKTQFKVTGEYPYAEAP